MAFHLDVFGAVVAVANIYSPLNLFPGDNGSPQPTTLLLQPDRTKLFRCAHFAPHGLRARVTSSTLDPQAWPVIAPINITPLTAAPPTVLDFGQHPIVLAPFKDISVDAVTDGVVPGTARTLLWLTDDLPEKLQLDEPPIKMHFTAAAILLSNAWLQTPIVFDQRLPIGTYAIVGAACFGAGLTAFRFVGDDPDGKRPGGIGFDTVDGLTPPWQRDGGMGEWMRFGSTHQPLIEVTGMGAVSTLEGVLDLIHIPDEPATPPEEPAQ